MKRNKNNKFKSGASLIVMVACMAVVTSVFGYFVATWILDYVSAPEEEVQPVEEEQIVQEETINPEPVTEEGAEEQVTSETDSEQSESEPPEQTEPEETNSQAVEGGEELYVVQVGAFSEEANAQGMVEKLKEAGFTGYITSESPYRVQAGAFQTEAAAQELEEKLQQNGFSVYIRD